MMRYITYFLVVCHYNLLLLPYSSNTGSSPSCCFFVQAQINWIHTLEAQVKDVSNALDKFVNVNLGVEHMQNHLKNITKKKKVADTGPDILRTFHESLQKRVQLANKTLGPIIEAIKEDFKRPSGVGDGRLINSCCDYDKSKLNFSSQFKTEVNFDDICSYDATDHAFCPSQLRSFEKHIHKPSHSAMLQTIKKAYTGNVKQASRHIYFGTKDGFFVAYPADNPADKVDHGICGCAAFDPRFRPWYPNIVNTEEGKEYVIVVDFSSAMIPKLLVKAKEVINSLLRMIDTKDMISLRVLSGDEGSETTLKTSTKYECLHSLTEAYPSIINVLKDFVATSKTGQLLKYTKIFKDSFRLFSGNNKKKKLFVLVTSGNYDESYNEVKEQFRDAVALQCDVKISFYLIQETESKQIIAEHENLRKEACSKCKERKCNDNNANFQLVHVYATDNEANIRQKVSKIYNSFKNDLGPPQMMFTMPYEDFYGLGTMIDACIRVVDDEGNLLAVLCLSFLSNELFGITSEIENTGDAYPFLIENSGTTYLHPYYVDPVLHDSGHRLDITNFETSVGFVDNVYSSMKSGDTGSSSFTVDSSKPLGILGAKFESKNFTYIWKQVDKSSFSIGVAVSSSYKNSLKLSPNSTQGNELYHRISKQPNIQNSLCNHQGYIATKAKPVINLALDVFEQPSIYKSIETTSTIELLTGYFNKNPKKSPNHFKSSTIRSKVRQDVMSTNLMNEYWLKDKSHETNIIVWRYVGMESGVFRIYPGIEFPQFDPRKQLWYHLAESLPGKLVFTPPYVNSKGDTIFSINKQLVKGLDGVSKGVGVIGMDFNFKYFNFLMKRDLTICAGQIRDGDCSIINTDGYFLFRKDVPDASRNIHLVEKEARISKMFLIKKIMLKSSCVEYNNRLPRTIWFYSLDHIKDSQTDNTTFWLIPVHGTNLLLLWTKHEAPDQSKCLCGAKSNTSNEIIQPCEQNVDLQNTCECPCYTEKACLNDIFKSDAAKRTTLICQKRSFQQSMPISNETINVMKGRLPLPDCFPIKCSSFNESGECVLYGCLWKSKTCIPIPTTPSPTTTTQDVNKGGSEGSDDETMIIVIVVSVIAGLIIIFAVVVLYFKKTRKQPERFDEPSSSPPPLPQLPVEEREMDGF